MAESRIERVREIMRRKGVDWIVFLRYSYNSEPMMDYLLEEETDESLLLITSRRAYLFASPLVIDALRCRSGIILVSCRNVMEKLDSMAKRLGRKPAIGVASSRMPLLFARRIGRIGRIVDLESEIDSAREVKEIKEVALLKKAASLTESILSGCFLRFSSFRTERDVRNFLVDEASVYGGTAFEPIVASGRNSRIPHAKAGGRLSGGFCIVDFGVKYRRYHADISRTVFLRKNSRQPSARELEVFRRVIEARDAAFEKVKHGVSAASVDKAARDILKDNLVHSLGHGVGVEIHEGPFLRPASEDIIRAGNIFTLEPAFYNNSFGVRVEDMVFVSERGPKFISGPQRSLLTLKIK